MGIIPAVTAHTVDRCPFEDSIRVAVLAINLLVTAHELEGKQVMIDPNLPPVLWRVASATAAPQNPLMNVNGLVTGIALPVCPGKDTSNMTPPAGKLVNTSFLH